MEGLSTGGVQYFGFNTGCAWPWSRKDTFSPSSLNSLYAAAHCSLQQRGSCCFRFPYRCVLLYHDSFCFHLCHVIFFFVLVWNKKTFSLGEHLLLLRDMCVKHKERWWGGMWTNLRGMSQWDGPVPEIMNFFSSFPKSLKKLFIISQKCQTWRCGLVKI